MAGEGWIDIVFDDEGTYTYYIKEIRGTMSGMTYSDKVVKVIITVTYDTSNKLTAKAVYDTNANDAGLYEFINEYKLTPVDVSLDVNK